MSFPSTVRNVFSPTDSHLTRQKVQKSEPDAAHVDATEINVQSKLHCHWVGPMPVWSFLNAFLDIGQRRVMEMPKCSDNYFDALPRASKEPELVERFINLVSDSHISPNLKLFGSSKNEAKENVTMSHRDMPSIMAYDSNANITSDHPTTFSQCEVIFEFQSGNGMVELFSEFSARTTEGELKIYHRQRTENGCRDRKAQLACYARAWMARQHRTHCFLVWIGDPWARIIRFDRSGAIVTEPFYIRSESPLLLEFLWRFSRASPEMRGKDTTVSIVTNAEEITLAKEKLGKWPPSPGDSRDVLKLNIPDGGSVDCPQWREVLVWGPLADPQCIVGRATRGYPAWDLKDHKHVFVKDSWRVLAEDVSKETDILKTLNDAEVCNIPTLVCGDDLPNQTTITQEFANATWNKGRRPRNLSKRIHIRFVSDLIGTHLTEFRSSKEFVRAWLDALLAHKEAYEKCGILHRDISVNNILFKPDGGGFLNDWDLARSLDDIEAGPRQPCRSGTWPFMSINVLCRPNRRHTLQDDLESFFWVLLYVTIRCLATNLANTGSTLPILISTIFDTAVNGGTDITDGSCKESVVLERKFLGPDFSVTDNAALTGLIDEMLCLIRPLARFWKAFPSEALNLSLRESISLEAAERLYLEVAKNTIDDFGFNHLSMIELAVEALNKEWPTKDAACDCFDQPSKSFTCAKPNARLNLGGRAMQCQIGTW